MRPRKSDMVLSVLVIVAGLFIFVLGAFLVSGGWEQYEPKARYEVVFTDGGGISGGDKVYLDGQRVGFVLGTRAIRRSAPDGRLLRVEATIEVNRKAEIPVDSRLIVTKTITRVIALEITSGKSKQLANSKTELLGEQFKTFEETKQDALQLLKDFQSTRQHVVSMFDNIHRIGGDVDLGPIRRKADEAFETLDRAFGTAIEILDGMRAPADEVGSNFERGLSEWRGLGRDVADQLPALRDKARAAGANVDEAAREAREAAADASALERFVEQTSGRFEAAAAGLPAVAHAVEEAVVEAKPQVRQVIGDAEEAGARFQTLKGELLRAPWRLTYKASAAESAAVHRSNAVRLYLEAANEVSRTIEGLDALRRLGVLNDPRQADLVASLLDRLRGALDALDRHEARLVALLRDAPAAPAK